jgi:hypothetical protein
MTPRPEDRADPVGLAYDRYASGLFRYAVVLLGDEAAAADAVHQVFAAWLRQRRLIDNDEHHLRRAVRNEYFRRWTINRAGLENMAKGRAQMIRGIRCARLRVSNEPLKLVDPFTGRFLELVTCKL